MSKIYNYNDFLNEKFFSRIFGKKSKVKEKPSTQKCVEEIIKFLSDNDINSWDDFIYSNKTDKYIINKLIDNSSKNMEDLKEIRFLIRLELSNTQQLKDFLRELEENEEYEKCARIIKKLSHK